MLGRHKVKAIKTDKQNDDSTRNIESDAFDCQSIPKQERPRICLIDVETRIVETLVARGFNCFNGTLGSLIEVPNTVEGSSHLCLLNYRFPHNLHEYDIIVIDLQVSRKIKYIAEEHSRTEAKGSKQFYFVSSFPETIFDPRPFSSEILRSMLQPIFKKKSILVVFTASQEHAEYTLIEISSNGANRHSHKNQSLYNFFPNLPYWEDLTGLDTNVVISSESGLTDLLRKHNRDAKYFITFKHPTHPEESIVVKNKNFFPLMETSPGKIVSFLSVEQENLSIFFPDIKEKEKFVLELFEKVLPEFAPSLFPYSTEFAWLNDPEYLLPNVKELNQKKVQIHIDYKNKLSEIDTEINDNRERFLFLHDMITRSGANLVKSVEEFLKWLEFDNVVNVDETNPELKEEDLRVETKNGILVIEVKGIGGTSTDRECSQISKIKFRRSKERSKFDVFGLYCVNHQRFLSPESRQNPPFKNIQIPDAKNDERGLLTTYDLFKLYFNITQGFVTKEDARKALFSTGLVQFPPSNSIAIPEPYEIHHDGRVLVFKANGLKLRIGMKVLLDDQGRFRSATILEIQKDGQQVSEIDSGEVGIKLSEVVMKATKLWLKHENL